MHLELEKYPDNIEKLKCDNNFNYSLSNWYTIILPK